MDKTNKEQGQSRKGFWARLVERLDRKMAEQARKSDGCCCGDKSGGKGSCSR